MSMAGMLGKMVLAGLVAKGMGKVMGGSRGGAGGALGGLLGGKNSGGGGLGGLLGSLAGGGAAQQGGSKNGGIGDILDSFTNDAKQAESMQPSAEQNQQAEVLLRALLNAAKSDGQIDQAEQQRIVKHLGTVSDEEERFVREVMSAPLDVDGFIRSVPRGMEQQVYLMSLTAIDLDTKAEAQYLHKLAQGLNISQQACNSIHQQLGAPLLYS